MTLIEELREETTGLCHSNAYHPLAQYDNGYRDGLERAIEIAERHSDWIPASEQLPPHEDDVEYYNYSESVIFFTKYEQSFIGYYDYMLGCWFTGKYKIDNTAVLAWQPSPKPYEGERK